MKDKLIKYYCTLKEEECALDQAYLILYKIAIKDLRLLLVVQNHIIKLLT